MEQPSTELSDNHTLYVRIGALDYDETFNIMKRYVNNALAILNTGAGTRTECKYRINIPRGSNGQYYGFCYCWVTEPQVYNILTGKNADGSPRVTYQEKPNHKSNPDDWADDGRVAVAQSPLVDTIVAMREDGTEVSVVIYPALTPRVDKDLYPHTLFCSGLPGWVTSKMICVAFVCYSNHGRAFPNVKINTGYNGNKAFIEFKQGSNDAYFALLMSKKVTFTDPATGDKHESIFYHAKK